MSRTFLLGAASALVLSTVSHANPIYGGGSSLVSNDVGTSGTGTAGLATVPAGTTTELGLSNQTATDLFAYDTSGSGAGRNAFVTNDETCNVNNIAFTGAAGVCDVNGQAARPGVDFGQSDAPIAAAELTYYNNNFAAADGALIQAPYLGTPVSIPVVNSAVTGNGFAGYTTSAKTTACSGTGYCAGYAATGQVTLSDGDICGIFSGKITNWSQVTDAGLTLAAGQITVVYRSDSSGTTNLFTTHLNKVCNSNNSNFAGTTPTTGPAITSTFASILPSPIPANFVGAKGSGGVQADLVAKPPVANIGYISPDFTSITVQGRSGAGAALFVAGLTSASTGSAGYTPTVGNTALSLASATSFATGSPTSVPNTATKAANPNNWVELPQSFSSGYAIAGYTNILLATCYNETANAGATKTILADLNNHYGFGSNSAAYQTVINNNGFTPATAYLSAISKWFLNANSAALNIGNATCASAGGKITGR